MRSQRSFTALAAPLVGVGAVVLAAALIAACADEQHPEAPAVPSAPEAGAATSSGSPPGHCPQAIGQSYPARLRVVSADAGAATGDVIVLDDLAQQFESACGSCHGRTVGALGGFQIATKDDFQTKMTADVLAHVTSNGGPSEPLPMPPLGSATGKKWSDRPATGDVIRDFVNLVQAWLDAGKPSQFTRPGAAPAGATESGDYLFTAASGAALTNIGGCIPTRELFATEETRSAALDAMFEAATRVPAGPDVPIEQHMGLPMSLADTDLFTFDSRTLARYGVVAYAPGYPLWSDDAGKLRFIRVPRGTSIRFDKAKQTFTIPPNTRFYKTFLKPVIEMDGSIRWKKVETRLIVSRKNPADDDDTSSPPALFGTYRWNDAETSAELVHALLRNSEPFPDTVLQYVSDEPLAADLLVAQPKDTDQALLEGRAARHYAIPSSERCIECHRGSVGRDFVLGFTPLQIARRPRGEGGTIEATSVDELGQLQRFIDYGLITGVDSLDDVVPLERSEGSRKPRNDSELIAQGYMLGNCAHCHNPHGDPTVHNPVLKDVFNLLPSDVGGIFQFPLERYSPRITRGAKTAVQVPYITPSLLDLPEDAAFIVRGGGVIRGTIDADGTKIDSAVYAPWRSLIYRNVDAAFSYTDDLALFPHMPRNTPGYDNRARQIMSDWMVSIPAVPKSHGDEYALRQATGDENRLISRDDSPQPYVEVPPGTPGYDDAAVAHAAQVRLAILHSGENPALAPAHLGAYSRYADPGDRFDILDPAVVADPVCTPVPLGSSDPNDPYPFVAHAHWVTRDLTEPADWRPRRSDWPDALVEEKPSPPPSRVCKDPGSVAEAKRDGATAVGLLQDPAITLDAIRAFATTPAPMGRWKAKATCDFSGVPRARDLAGNPPAWLGHATNVSPDDPIYMQSPGATVFKAICINCHGPRADSDGRMAANLAEMTGGSARVANFRNGLVGPLASPGANLTAEFGSRMPAKWAGVKPEDAAARYMAFMALGGTNAQIPDSILSLVGTTTVLGERRATSSVASANMLATAKQICLSFLGPRIPQVRRSNNQDGFDFDPTPGHGYLDVDNGSLIRTNGDAEMWLRMCTTGNPPPVHVIRDGDHMDSVLGNDGNVLDDRTVWILPSADYARAGTDVTCKVDGDCAPVSPTARCDTGAGHCRVPVGNDRGGVDDSINAANLWPWCVKAAAPAAGLPVCPPKAPSYSSADAANEWAVRGAINAGLSVFLYVQWLETHAPDADYDACEARVPPTPALAADQ